MNEADEVFQGKPRSVIISNLREKMQQYRNGQESMGVLMMYELAAIRVGIGQDEIEQLRRDVNS